MRIGNRDISRASRPYVVAEMSGNHNQSLDRAIAIVEAAARAGAHGLKLQTYTADTMTLDVRTRDFQIEQADSLWQGRNLYDLYKEAHTPWEWHAPIMQRARELGMECFSTPFDESAVEFLERLGVPCYKIASFENTDLPLIRRVAATGKPVIMSTGMATVAELDEAVRTAREAGCRDLVLLKCTSTYPATPENSNVMVLVEKHFTLRRADGGVDSAFSLEPEEMALLATETERAWQSLGHVRYGPSDAEKPSLKFRRSLFVTKDLKAGEPLSADNVRCLRPALGLPAKYLDLVIGKKVSRAVKRGTPVTWDLFA
jgi:sialic acid synthase SpsE